MSTNHPSIFARLSIRLALLFSQVDIEDAHAYAASRSSTGGWKVEVQER